LNVAFASNATDPDGRIANFRWEFGDGTSTSEPNPSHVYVEPGQYTATLTVMDDRGATASDSVNINVTRPHTEPVVRVLTPNNRATLKGASVYEITWSSQAVGLTEHEIHLSIDNGKTWRLLVAGLPPQTKLYEWQVLNKAAKRARIRVVSRAGHLAGSDTSDDPFAIKKTKTKKKKPSDPRK
jgi:PKD repeat protein